MAAEGDRTVMKTTFRQQLCGTVAALVVVISAVAVNATSILNGIEPGVGTRAQAEKVFGPPIESITSTRFAYVPTEGTSGIEIEYTAAQMVDRIDLTFAPGLPREIVVSGLNLPADAAGSEIKQGRFVEYYAGSRTLVLTHEAGPSSPVSRVSYCSRTMFDALTAAVIEPDADGPFSAAVEFSNAEDKPVIVQFNPNACRDTYNWAQREHDSVRQGRNAVRRQAILDVMITAQKGDCPRALELSAAYRKAYSDWSK